MKFNNRGLTFVEIVTVLAIVGIVISIFYSVFFLHSKASSNYMVRADLAQDMNLLMDQMTFDGRESSQISVTNSPTEKRVSFVDVNLNPIATYTMLNNGLLNVSRDGGATTETLAFHVDFQNSSFIQDGESLEVHLRLVDDVLGDDVIFDSTIQIYPRN